ncbi:MAG: lamin tail domain-containing protein, partial [Chloroflexota bacterium]|nr:lamin tail domain-containing protein [Chloroflexota bacterium]
IIYGNQAQAIDDQAALLAWLAATGTVAQWQSTKPPAATGLIAVAADNITVPGDLPALQKHWLSANVALLPAGNANPPLPSALDPAPRYTGLAVSALDEASLLQALTAHRGWLTSTPGLWLTVQAELAGGERYWMGSQLLPSNEMTLHIYYGDRSGGVAGLAIWQNNAPLYQLDAPPPDGRWSITLPAVPNSLVYVVATQIDGDFAVTAPLQVLSGDDATVVINEVLPAPATDHNGDGSVDGDDEFIELYNPGSQPFALGGWQLSDVNGDVPAGHRFTFGANRALNGGEHLLLWKAETRINLNVTQDYVRLLNPAGEEIDRINWGESPAHGASISRVPDGQKWRGATAVTPGQPNQRAEGDEEEESNDDDDDEEERNLPPPLPTLEPSHGQAGGPPGSLAQSKLAGLEASVELHAVVVAPPGLYNSSIYVADPAPNADGPYAGIGINVYLRRGDFPALQEGDRISVRGELTSFRGEMELELASVDQIWRMEPGVPLLPLPVGLAEVGETLEGRLVTFAGVVSSWQGDSIYLVDPATPLAEPVRVTIRSSLGWRRPYVNHGDRFQVTGVVSQFAQAAPWNGHYRVLVRYKEDLVKIKK